MTARGGGGGGASNRMDLFKEAGAITTSRRDAEKNKSDAEHGAGLTEDTDNDSSNPLHLEHMLGYSGDYKKTLIASPSDENVYFKSLGCLVSMQNLNDAHSQVFLRGHDMPVCALSVSNSGVYIASGQMGTIHYKGNAAPIFLWHVESQRRLAVLRGLTGRITAVSFSLDEMFLCACDEDCLLYIWDLTTGEVAFGQKVPSSVVILKWTEQKKVNHHIAYELMLGIGTSVTQGMLTYDAFREQWSLKLTPYQVPPNGGLIRSFHCVDMSMDRTYIYVGTTSGEMLVYRRDTLVFRACIPVCSNGLVDLIVLPDESVLCGGGDGVLVKLRGRDVTWQVIKQIKIDSTIRSMSLSCNGVELLISCTSGEVLRCLADNLSYSTVSTSHTSSISCIAFPTDSGSSSSSSSDGSIYFATGTISGEVKVWDLVDYTCLSAMRFPKSGVVKCLTVPSNNTILSGWQDGTIRCSNANGQLMWFIPTAHRDGTTSIASHVDPSLQYFVTGGGDGAVRVWKYTNRELMTQYTEHRKGVSKVLIDFKSPNIVHSVGGDCSVLSFDLKASRRIICHIINSGTMIDMTQRRDAELELITSDSLGRLLHWDIDIRDPVMAVQDPSKAAIRACEISPSGRFLGFAGDDQILKVLDSLTNQIVAMGQAHSSAVTAISWTPDEKQVISGGADSSLCIWNFFLGGV